MDAGCRPAGISHTALVRGAGQLDMREPVDPGDQMAQRPGRRPPERPARPVRCGPSPPPARSASRRTPARSSGRTARPVGTGLDSMYQSRPSWPPPSMLRSTPAYTARTVSPGVQSYPCRDLHHQIESERSLLRGDVDVTPRGADVGRRRGCGRPRWALRRRDHGCWRQGQRRRGRPDERWCRSAEMRDRRSGRRHPRSRRRWCRGQWWSRVVAFLPRRG
jgi:hypothetical protein